jgi:hypothetical protein
MPLTKEDLLDQENINAQLACIRGRLPGFLERGLAQRYEYGPHTSNSSAFDVFMDKTEERDEVRPLRDVTPIIKEIKGENE